MDKCDIDPLWGLHDEFTVEQAAALIAGYDPGYVARCRSDTNFESTFSKLYPAQTALINASNAKKLKVELRYSAREYGYADQLADLEYAELESEFTFGRTAKEDEIPSGEHSCFYKPFPDWTLSTVNREDLMAWLVSRGMKTGFFFQATTDAPDYLDSNHPRYAPKLAASVNAWLAVTAPNGRHPKQALTKWLREHAAEFGLSDEEGKPNETGIEEVAKVANWQPGGGAPKTPSE